MTENVDTVARGNSRDERNEKLDLIKIKRNQKTIKDKITFSKDNTLALKGVAIIMMMFHHLFREETLFSNYSVLFFPFSENLVTEMSLMFKICVSIFAFLTGYGLTLSLKKLNQKYEWTSKQISTWTVGRLIKTLSGFWFIAVLAYIVCQIIDGRTGEIFFQNGILYGIIKLVINFLGLSDFFGTDNFNSSWWYMSVAVLFILSVPIFLKLFKRYGYVIVLIATMIIPRVLGWEYVNSSYISFIFPVLLGIIFAENNLMVKIANIKVHKDPYVSKIIKFIIETVIVILLVRIYSELPPKQFWEIRYGIIPVCIMCYLYEFFIDLPIVKQVLQYLGKHSMNIFLIHEFIRGYYLTNFIYSFNNFIIIALVLLLSSLAISIIMEELKKEFKYNKLIDKLQNFLNDQINKIYNKHEIEECE